MLELEEFVEKYELQSQSFLDILKMYQDYKYQETVKKENTEFLRFKQNLEDRKQDCLNVLHSQDYCELLAAYLEMQELQRKHAKLFDFVDVAWPEKPFVYNSMLISYWAFICDKEYIPYYSYDLECSLDVNFKSFVKQEEFLDCVKCELDFNDENTDLVIGSLIKLKEEFNQSV